MFLFALNATHRLPPYMPMATLKFGLQLWLTNRVQLPKSFAAGHDVS